MIRGEAEIRAVFAGGRKVFIPFLVAGDPNPALSRRLILKTAAEADLFELGLPFSDPLADGPVIQRGSQRALRNGPYGLAKIWKEASALKALGLRKPLILLTYANPLLQGLDKLPLDGRSPFSAAVVPDLPEDEAPRIRARLNQAGVALVGMVAPTTPPARLKRIASGSQGFIYLVSVTGVTGLRGSLPAEIPARVRALKKISRMPVALGFGVSDEAMAARVARICDGVVVGSAMVREVEKCLTRPAGAPERLGAFARRLCRAVHRASPARKGR